MHTWKLDSGDYLSSMLVDSRRCSSSSQSSSSDDDSADSGCFFMPWIDEYFVDAYLQENIPTGWSSLRCECGDNKLSLCSFCLQNSSDSLFSLPCDDVSRTELLTFPEPVFDQNFFDRLYPDNRDDLVVLGVDLHALSSAVLCSDDPKTPCPCAGNLLPPTACVHNSKAPPQLLHQQPGVKQQNSSPKNSVLHPEWLPGPGTATAGGFPFAPPPAVNKAPQATRPGRRGGGRRAVPDEDKIFPCPYAGCARVYSKNSHLRAHLRRHTGEKPFVCQWPGCKWRFSRSDELARHKRSHSGIKPYQCSVCGKRFGRSDHLAKHVRIHRKQGYVVPQKTNSRAAPAVKVQILTARA